MKDKAKAPAVGDTVDVFDGRPKRNEATIIAAKVTAVHAGNLVDVVAHRPVAVGTREGDCVGDEYALTNLTPCDEQPFRAGQYRQRS